jgi:Na+-driven multidrug efflux pump
LRCREVQTGTIVLRSLTWFLKWLGVDFGSMNSICEVSISTAITLALIFFSFFLVNLLVLEYSDEGTIVIVSQEDLNDIIMLLFCLIFSLLGLNKLSNCRRIGFFCMHLWDLSLSKE